MGSPRSERLTNIGLAAIVGLAVGTGLVANAIGPEGWLHPSLVHGIVGLSVLLLVPWKAPIARRGLRRRRSARLLSLLLAVLTLVTVASGLVHATGVARIGPLTVMQVHVGAAVGVAVAVVVHMRTRPVKIRLPDLDRRTVLAGLATAAGAVALRSTWEAGLHLAGASGADRRFTRSHERGSHDQRAMPVTQWLDDSVPSLDRADHLMTVDGTAWTVERLESLGTEVVEATIDCTGGWFAIQR